MLAPGFSCVWYFVLATPPPPRLTVAPSKKKKKAAPAAAWSDSDDDDVVVDLAAKSRLRKLRKTEEEVGVAGADFAGRLRKRFVESSAPQAWAVLRDDDRVEDGVTHTGSLVAASTALPRDEITVTRQRDVNHADPCKAVVQSVQFHPSGQLALTAGFDQRIRIFQVRFCISHRCWLLRSPRLLARPVRSLNLGCASPCVRWTAPRTPRSSLCSSTTSPFAPHSSLQTVSK